MTLLETVQDLKGEALETWLETLTIEEKKDLWAQCIVHMVDIILPSMEAFFGPTPREVCDG